MAYTTIDKPSDYFNTVLYTGTENSNTISVGFEPDFTWIKRRNSARDHQLFNSITGANTVLSSNLTSAEEGTGAGGWTPNSDGFVVHQHVKTNSNGDTYVGWNWKAETSFTNDASSTSVGSIDSTGSVNTDAGFSIITFTGNNTNDATIAHGLGTTPAMIITKNREDVVNWRVWHKNLPNATDVLFLNGTNAAVATSAHANGYIKTVGSATYSTHASNSDANGVNGDDDDMIAYCFAEKQGYSKIGSYTGNGNADGSFVYTGFKPAWIIFKRLATNDWFIVDNKIHDFNKAESASKMLRPNLDNAEQANNTVDLLSNGFKARNANDAYNASGSTYIYMAFAEQPFVTSTGVPATAR